MFPGRLISSLDADQLAELAAALDAARAQVRAAIGLAQRRAELRVERARRAAAWHRRRRVYSDRRARALVALLRHGATMRAAAVALNMSERHARRLAARARRGELRF